MVVEGVPISRIVDELQPNDILFIDSSHCESLDDFFGDSVGESCWGALLHEMDIEGGEWLASHGARRVLSYPKFPVSLLIEVHPQQITALGGSVPGLNSLLQSMGFQVYALTPAGVQTLTADSNARFWWASSNAE